MIKKLLIANRGEIAVRIIRTCKEMGIKSVAVYSEADADALHVKSADEAVCIGPANSKQSYLNVQNLISAAVLTNCDAIHPGVGFLAENSGFALQVKEQGLLFIGPDPEVIRALGDKVRAKQTAKRYNVPVIPGTEGSVEDLRKTQEEIDKLGYPLIVKAAAGGGGKGLRIVWKKESLAESLKIASHEAELAFSDGTMYIEKYLENPRHVELQILADRFGNVIHLGERDCSVQKNHQKLVEESPSPGVTAEMRQAMGEAAVRLFKGIHYTGAGTIEFLVKDNAFYFMEVNARVQVEHPVTEMVTGVDIIKEQILTCCGEPVSLTQKEIHLDGYALECRINAMAPGKVISYLPPGGFKVRVDSLLHPNGSVPPFYDALVAKVLVAGHDRKEGIERMRRVLSEFHLEGVPVNLELQKKIIAHPLFQSGDFGTSVLETILKEV